MADVLRDMENRIIPLMMANMRYWMQNPEQYDEMVFARQANGKPVCGGDVSAPDLHDTGELEDAAEAEERRQESYARLGYIHRYESKWDESKHPRAADGRFGTKSGTHGGSADGGGKASGGGGSGGQKRISGGGGAPQPAAGSPQGEPTKDGSQTDEPVTEPPPGGYAPDPAQKGPDGYTERARVGVGGKEVPPPPSKIPRLNNLTADERKAESNFADAFESDPDGMAAEFMRQVMYEGIADGPNVFATDDAKLLSGDWNPHGAELAPILKKQKNKEPLTPEEQQVLDDKLEVQKAHNALYNTATHQTANAVAKRAFLKYLDEVVSQLPEERRTVLVTAGGVASGKGFAIGNVPEVSKIQNEAGAVWDTAGEQNSTELPWLTSECEKRGIKVMAAYIHADPQTTWPRAVGRANDRGRMVDARVFADSYKLGAENFEQWRQDNANNPNVSSFIIDGTKTIDPSKNERLDLLDSIPDSAKVPVDETYKWATEYLNSADVKPVIKRAGTAGQRIWKNSRRATYRKRWSGR